MHTSNFNHCRWKSIMVYIIVFLTQTGRVMEHCAQKVSAQVHVRIWSPCGKRFSCPGCLQCVDKYTICRSRFAISLWVSISPCGSSFRSRITLPLNGGATPAGSRMSLSLLGVHSLSLLGQCWVCTHANHKFCRRREGLDTSQQKRRRRMLLRNHCLSNC